MKDFSTQQHRLVYDSLAQEYEQRVNKLTTVTNYALDQFSKYLPNDGKVLDIGCAVGLAVNLLANRGYDSAGVDISPNMVELARQRNPQQTIFEGDFLELLFEEEYYDGLLCFAFIHLFPKQKAVEILEMMWKLLKPDGVMYLGTTKSLVSSEGYQAKADYKNQLKRFRKNWTPAELEAAFTQTNFRILHSEEITDPFGKVWMDYIVKK